MILSESGSRPWLASYPNGVPHSIEYPDVPVGLLLDRVATAHPRAQAVSFQGFELNWRQVRLLADKASVSLAQMGVVKGDRVVLLLPNVPQFVVAYYAALKLGAIVVAASPLFSSEELEAYLGNAQPKVIITLDVLYEKVAETWERVGCRHLVVATLFDLMPQRVRVAQRVLQGIERLARHGAWYANSVRTFLSLVETRISVVGRIRSAPKAALAIPYGQGIRSFRSLLDVKAAGPKVHVDANDPAVLMYTTGTTGTPKAAILTHKNLVSNAYQIRHWFPELREGRETIMAILPFFHSYGLTLVMNAGLVLAARSVLIARPLLTDIFEAIDRFKPTALPGVPALFVSIVNSERARQYDLRSIRICVSGGAPLPVDVAERFDALTGGHLYEGYGLTEAAPLTHAQPWDRSAPHGSIGLPVSDTEARIVDDGGVQVPLGERGELIVRGPQIMAGYWRNEQETATTVRDGWLYTGDIATMDEKGFFFIVDRKKELIITGGENIVPREIEEVLYRHPLVMEAAVVGVPHTHGGEVAKAFIVLKSGQTLTRGELRSWLADKLAHYKIPREFEFRDQLPKSATGKVLKKALVAEERAAQAAPAANILDGGHVSPARP